MKKFFSIFTIFLLFLSLLVSVPVSAATKVKKKASAYNPIAVAKAKNIWWKNYTKVPKAKTEAMEKLEEQKESAKLGLSDVNLASSSTISDVTNTDQTVSTTVVEVVQNEDTTSSTVSIDFKFTRALKFGSVGEDVTKLQEKIRDEGFYKGPITGKFGKLTTLALKKYQKAHNIQQTGSIGPKTKVALNGN